MKMLSNVDFLIEAGQRVPNRDMSPYDGKPFQCACGRDHLFKAHMDYRNFGSYGANAKMMVTCPQNSSFATLIETKYKFIVIFDRFISLAGNGNEVSAISNSQEKRAELERRIAKLQAKQKT